MIFGQTFKTQKKNLRKKKTQTLISTLFKKIVLVWNLSRYLVSSRVGYLLSHSKWVVPNSLGLACVYYMILVVPMTFGHPWLRHSSYPEHAMVSTDIVRVSEPAVCTLRLSIRVFTPLPDVKKPKTLVLTF